MFSQYYNYATHTPICNTYHASMHLPTRVKLFLNNQLSTPRTIGVDGVMSYGGGTGHGLTLSRKAFGEYFERNHFFLSIPITSRHTLKDITSNHIREKLINCINQIKMTDDACDDHIFSFTAVKNILNDEPREYFFNALSLNGDKRDGFFYNFNDSCACASHTTKEDSLTNSLLEFLERQALLGSWMSRKYRYAIDPTVLLDITPYRELAKNFLENGTLYVFENGVNLPGYSTIIFYLSQCEEDLVQYSVGSSAGLTLEDSLKGSFEELWQCYLFQYNAENSKGLEDRSGSGYHLSFQKCNHAEIKYVIPFINQDIVPKITTAQEIYAQPHVTFKQAVNSLGEISEEIYYYHHYDSILGLHFSKIISPDFFSHMALEQRLNLINAYSKTLGITKENAYMEKIPFP